MAAVGVGALAGLVTGIIHVKFKVRDLLAGIITMTALFSVNLQIAGSNLSVERSIDTIFTARPVMTLLGSLPLIYRKLIVAAVIALVVKIILDLYFKTKNGLLLRGVGDNSVLVNSLAVDKGKMKILGLVIANALVALCAVRWFAMSRDRFRVQWVQVKWYLALPQLLSAQHFSKGSVL